MQYPGFLIVLGTIIVVVLLLLTLTPRAPSTPSLNVAFVGNSILFVNDVPRLMEEISGQMITQNSCLHGSLHFASLLQKGNGMAVKFHTYNALLLTKDTTTGTTTTNNATTTMTTMQYDYGACTVAQLLLGYDNNLSQYNSNGYYIDDGTNPCFLDPNYFDYVAQTTTTATTRTPRWDYVVLNDRTINPALVKKRYRSMRALKYTYLNYFVETDGAIPVLLMTHGYNHTDRNYSPDRLGDVPEFTSHLYYGYRRYYDILAQGLPPSQTPRLAPLGLALLVLWEENVELWKTRMFEMDQFHLSPSGSYLCACVLYATIYGHMPPEQYALPHNMSHLWHRARKMQVQSNSTLLPLPTRAEATYLYSIAQKVTLEGYLPKTLLSEDEVMALESNYLMEDYGNTDDYPP